MAYTELCIRSLHHFADAPFHLVVGDSFSRDGSREMLEAMAGDGWLELQVSESRVEHAQWLDRWIATATNDHLVFCDSDIQFLKRGLLSALNDAAGRGASLVFERVLAPGHYEDPYGATYMMPRPAPWVMFVHGPSVKRLDASFQQVVEPAPEHAEGRRTFDVAAKIYVEAVEAGLTVETFGWPVRRKYRHFANASWGTRSPLPVGRIRRRDATVVLGAGLDRMRRIRRQPSEFHV